MTAVEGEERFLSPSRRARLCAYRARTRLPLRPASRFSSLQGRNSLYAGGFRSRPFVASSPRGLLMPRSQVRSLHGPFAAAWLRGFGLEWRFTRVGSARNAHPVQTPVQTSGFDLFPGLRRSLS